MGFGKGSLEEMVGESYGGYWRYPEMLDFLHLTNPFFPTSSMTKEMKTRFAELIADYPSGCEEISQLAGEWLGLDPAYIVVGNGASELIRVYFELISGAVGFIRPAFEEYINRYDPKRSVYFDVPGPDYTYTAQDIIDHFDNKNADHLVVINPDNPGGNYIGRSGMKELAAWAKEKGIRLLTDESFADFAKEPDNSMLDRAFLEDNPHLVVIKSISKSYGVPGLRLGILASADRELISTVKKELPIWNINSFAEFFLQTIAGYREEFIASLETFRVERQRFFELLRKVEGLRVIPSESAYFMAEITNGMSAKDLSGRLLKDHNILIKDL